MPGFTFVKARVNAPSTDTEAHNRVFGEHKWISDQVFLVLCALAFLVGG